MSVQHTPGVDMKSIINDLARKRVRAGFFEHSKYPDGTSIALVAAVQDTGSVSQGIPARPFFRNSVKNNAPKYSTGVAAAFRRAVNGTQSVQQGLEQLGGVVAGDVQQEIRDTNSPALAESTVRARAGRNASGRASNKPLVDTGQMLQAVTYAVENV